MRAAPAVRSTPDRAAGATPAGRPDTLEGNPTAHDT